MTACPPPDHLRRMIEAALPPADQAAAEAHVDGCPACQATLEELTAAPPPPGLRAVDLTAETFIARVRDLARTAPNPRLVPDPGPAVLPDVPGYFVEAEVGRGGMGVVYRARHKRLNRLVALKMLTEYGLTDPAVRVRFLVEAEAVAQLQHPHVVQVYEIGEYAGRPYLAMEYVSGGTLADRLAAGPAFPPDRAAELVARLADAVAAAHHKGIIHRDLKPSNILLAAAADPKPGAVAGTTAPALRLPASESLPKVTDFGIARVGVSDLTATGEVLGTPSYMAPEQAAGRVKDVGTTTDVYGLGAILYECLAGRPPFLGQSAVETLQQVMHDDPRPPRAVNRAVPRDLDTICRKCLAKDPRKRYPTADALAADLRAYLSGRTITARPARAWERAARFARRNPTPTVAILLVAASVVGAFVWVNAARRQAQDDRDAALRARAGQVAALTAAERSAREAGLAAEAADRDRARAEVSRAETLFGDSVTRCENGDLGQGLAGLAEVRAQAARLGRPDLARVADWNTLAWKARLPAELPGPGGPDPARAVTAAAVAAGDRVVAGYADGLVRVWPAGGGPARELPPPDGAGAVVAVCPGADDTLVVVYAAGHVGECDLAKPDPPRYDRAFDFPVPVTGAAMTPPGREVSGRLVAAGAADGTFQLWNRDARRRLDDPPGGPPRHFFRGLKKSRHQDRPPPTDPARVPTPVTAVAFVENGNMMLTAGEEEGVILLGLPHGNLTRVPDPVPGGQPDGRISYHQYDPGGQVYALAADTTRQYFLCGGAAAVSLWSIHDRDRPVWSRPHPEPVTAVAFSPARGLCASADRGGTVRCWDVLSGALQAQFTRPGPVVALAFGPPAGGHLLVAGPDGWSRWAVPPGPARAVLEPEPTPVGPGILIPVGPSLDQAVTAAGFDPGRKGYWAATRGGLTLWPGRWFFTSSDFPLAAGRRPVGAAVVGPDGAWGVVAAGDACWVCDLTGVRAGPGLRLAAGADGVWACDQITSHGQQPKWREFPARRVAAGAVAQAGLLPGGRSFFTRSDAGFAAWDVAADGSVTRRAGWPLPAPGPAAPHPDGTRVLVGGPAGWRTGFRALATGAEVGPAYPHPGGVTAVAVDPRGRWVATGGPAGGVRVWAAADGAAVGRAVSSHAGRVTGLAFGFGPSAGVLATASTDGTARFRDVATGLPLGPALRHPEGVLSVGFDPTGRWVLTGCRNGSAVVWPAPRLDGAKE